MPTKKIKTTEAKKKLQLNRETLVTLTSSELGQVAGGTAKSYLSSCLDNPCELK